MRAVGAGTALSLTGGIAGASSDEHDEYGEGDGAADSQPREAGIDPVFGYPTTDAADVPAALEPDHEVEMTVTPPPGPGQPPFIHFEPVGLHVDSGDIVQFTASTPDHTVTAYHRGIGFEESRVPEAAEPFSSPVLGPGAAWLYRFEHEGVYDVYCGPHHILGMVMRLVVGDVAEEGVPEYARSVEGVPSSEDFTEQLNALSEQNENCEWPFLMPADVFGTDALDAMNIQQTGEVPLETVASELGYDLEEEVPAEPGAPTVQVTSHPNYGEILVGPDGMTLYMFDQDTQGEPMSSCQEGCVEAWPPLTVDGEPTAGDDVTAELETFERETGEMQVMANGWPLYYFAQDQEPGDVEGQGVQGAWWVLDPDGTPIRTEPGQ